MNLDCKEVLEAYDYLYRTGTWPHKEIPAWVTDIEVSVFQRSVDPTSVVLQAYVMKKCLASTLKELEQEKKEHDLCTEFHAMAVQERDLERIKNLSFISLLHRVREVIRWWDILFDKPYSEQMEDLRQALDEFDGYK
jgi:hypothetical protein